MGFFLQTLSQVFKGYAQLIKHDETALQHFKSSSAHWLLSWLMVLAGAFIYMIYLPSAFMSSEVQEYLPEGTSYEAYKGSNMVSLIFVMLISYILVYLLEKPLGYTGSVFRYIISQNWLFLATILIFVPLSGLTASMEEWSPLASVMIFVFMFVLFLAYRCNKLLLGISGPKAFALLVGLMMLEITLDSTIDRWFGLVKLAE